MHTTLNTSPVSLIVQNYHVPAPIPGVRHSGGPPFRGSGLGLGLTLADPKMVDPRNGGPPEWRTSGINYQTLRVCKTSLKVYSRYHDY